MGFLTDKEIEKFQALYKARYNEEITNDEANEIGSRLVSLVKALYLSPESEITRARLRKNNQKLHLNFDIDRNKENILDNQNNNM